MHAALDQQALTFFSPASVPFLLMSKPAVDIACSCMSWMLARQQITQIAHNSPKSPRRSVSLCTVGMSLKVAQKPNALTIALAAMEKRVCQSANCA